MDCNITNKDYITTKDYIGITIVILYFIMYVIFKLFKPKNKHIDYLETKIVHMEEENRIEALVLKNVTDKQSKLIETKMNHMEALIETKMNHMEALIDAITKKQQDIGTEFIAEHRDLTDRQAVLEQEVKEQFRFQQDNTEDVGIEFIAYDTKIQNLISTIDLLDPYETIEEFIYPSWDIIEEFYKHPHYKYFQAIKDFNTYFKVVESGNSALYLKKINGMYCTFNNWVFGRDNDGYIPSITEQYKMHGDVCLQELCSIVDNKNLTMTEKERAFFNKSAKKIISYGGFYTINDYPHMNTFMHLYIKQCIAGWSLNNFEHIVHRQPKYEIHIEGNSVRFLIKRLKQQVIDNKINYINFSKIYFPGQGQSRQYGQAGQSGSFRGPYNLSNFYIEDGIRYGKVIINGVSYKSFKCGYGASEKLLIKNLSLYV
jgi:hypothetical protein